MAKVLEQGPVLILTFSAQQLMMVRNAKGEIVEGGEVSPSKLLCMSHTSGAQGRGRGGEGRGGGGEGEGRGGEGLCAGAVQ